MVSVRPVRAGRGVGEGYLRAGQHCSSGGEGVQTLGFRFQGEIHSCYAFKDMVGEEGREGRD
jgi:hypothetical protein